MLRSIAICLFLVYYVKAEVPASDSESDSDADYDRLDAVMNCTTEHWDEISKVCNTFPTQIRQISMACLEEAGLSDMPCKIRKFLEEDEAIDCSKENEEEENKKYENFGKAVDEQCMEKCLLTKAGMMKDAEIIEKESTTFLTSLSFIKERNVESEVVLNFTECLKNDGTTSIHESSGDPACDKARIAVSCMQSIIIESFGICVAKECEKFM